MSDDPPKSKKVIVDPATGKWNVEYTYKGQPCTRIEFSSHVAAHYAAYQWIYSDLCDVYDWMAEAYKLAPPVGSTPLVPGNTYLVPSPGTNHKLLKAYMYAAVTLYGKCFTETKGRRIKLEESNIDEKYREAHQHAMTIRHTITAHAGKTEREWSTAVLVIGSVKEDQGVPIRLEVENARLGFVDDRTTPIPFLALVDHVRTIVDRKRSDLLSKLKAGEAVELLSKMSGEGEGKPKRST